MTRRDKMIARINELKRELAALEVTPEKDNLNALSDDGLMELGFALADQVNTRRRFLGLDKEIGK